MTIDADKFTKVFETKEEADSVAAQLISKFRMFECKVRKSLPTYKGERNKTFTLYIKAATFAEQCEIKMYLKGL